MHFSIADHPVHPHIKLTNEDYPRPLATRVLKEDGDEYFGAFLNRTSVRILIDFLNRIFRLRSCTIGIDGSFPVPCTQYYARRCVAPCVASLCSHENYLDLVQLVRLFLRDDRELFLAAVSKKIEDAVEGLDFETAAFFRDMLLGVEEHWSNSRYRIWLDDSVDTFEVEEAGDDSIVVIIVSQRGRRTLGELVFAFPKFEETLETNAVGDVIRQLYKFHVPREIRVPYEFRGRKALASELKTKIVVTGPMNRRITAERAVEVAKAKIRLARAKHVPTSDELIADLATRLGLNFIPQRIEAYDVAHISATGFAAAVSVWAHGGFYANDYEHWLSNEKNELETLREFIAGRLSTMPPAPDLILVDGGQAHLKAAVASVQVFQLETPVIGVVKPRGKHSSISHLLTEDGHRIEFDPDVEAFRIIQRLRDDAHDLANATHRLSRDMMHFYELAAMLPSLNERAREQLFKEFGSIRRIVEADEATLRKRLGDRPAEAIRRDLAEYENQGRPAARPLIVPIRFVDTDGAADDLIPIVLR